MKDERRGCMGARRVTTSRAGTFLIGCILHAVLHRRYSYLAATRSGRRVHSVASLLLLLLFDPSLCAGTSMAPSSWLLAGAALLSIVVPSDALYFYMSASTPKCFHEELPKDTLVVGKHGNLHHDFEKSIDLGYKATTAPTSIIRPASSGQQTPS